MEANDDTLIIKFPRTYHLFDTGGVGRDDLVHDAKTSLPWYKNVISLEEKVDGANLGISIGPDNKLQFQNRSHWVTSSSQAQWRQLDSWAEKHAWSLHQLLGDRRYILYGEWCYAKHSIHYARLPDLFLAFDIYDKSQGRFLSRVERDRLLDATDIARVPLVDEGVFNKEQLLKLLNSTQSKFYDGPVEGLYLRMDEGQYLKDRAKIVRKDFLQSDEFDTHWMKKGLTKNIVLY